MKCLCLAQELPLTCVFAELIPYPLLTPAAGSSSIPSHDGKAATASRLLLPIDINQPPPVAQLQHRQEGVKGALCTSPGNLQRWLGSGTEEEEKTPNPSLPRVRVRDPGSFPSLQMASSALLHRQQQQPARAASCMCPWLSIGARPAPDSVSYLLKMGDKWRGTAQGPKVIQSYPQAGRNLEVSVQHG